MAETTVRELAGNYGVPVEKLLAQLGESGLPHIDADQQLDDQQRDQWLAYLRRLHGKGEGESAAPRKVSLRRQSVSDLRIASPQGRRKTVTVETRKRRAHMPGAGGLRAGPGAAAVKEESDTKARMDAAKRALHEEAKRRQQELDEPLRVEAGAREKAEALRKLSDPEKKERVLAEEQPVPEPGPEPVEAAPPVVEAAVIEAPEPSTPSSALADSKCLFDTSHRFKAQLRPLMELHLEQVTNQDVDEYLRRLVSNAVRDLEPHPEDALTWIRRVTNRALDLIWDAELPGDGKLPPNWLKDWRSGDAKNLPEDGRQLRHSGAGTQCSVLRHITGSDRIQRKSRYVTKPTYLLVHYLKSVGDFIQHQSGSEYQKTGVAVGFAATGVLAAISLVEHLTAELPPRDRSG